MILSLVVNMSMPQQSAYVQLIAIDLFCLSYLSLYNLPLYQQEAMRREDWLVSVYIADKFTSR